MKVQGTYSSVIKGVSQQAPADRLEGQHGEVVNMVMDPVRGAVRRNGSIMENQQISSVGATPSNAVLDSFSYRSFEHRDGVTDYDFLYRSRARVGESTDAHLDLLVVRNKTDQNGAWVATYRDPGDEVLDQFDAGGISAACSLGRYVLLAANDVSPTYNLLQGVDNPAWTTVAAAWVRGGSYGRTFTIKAKRASNGQTYSVQYTTPLSTYPGTLDFRNIPPAAVGGPYEGYYANVIQADYDTAVNQWTASASAAIVPAAIAQQLVAAMTSAGWSGWQVISSHLFNDDVEWIEVTDGGDGDYFRAVHKDVQSPDDLTEMHIVGKVVRVQPDKTDDGESYYLKAYNASEGNAASYQTVVWREAAGVVQTPTFVAGIGTLEQGTFYYASTPALLAATVLAEAGVTLDVPELAPSEAGDLDSNPPPPFMGKRITMLAAYGNRLAIGSGATVSWSKVGDYFQWYRTTMLTIPDDDPFNAYAVGTETDTIRQAVTYDQNLMLLGDKFHYAISGRQPLVASAPRMAVQSAISGTAYAAPQGIGDFVFIAKEDNQLAATRLLQLQAGAYQDSPKLTDVSQPLRDYVNGTPAELVALTSPACVFVRTEHFMKSEGGFPRARPWGIYLYQYLDTADGQRITEAWGAWEWSTALGTPIGMTATPSGDGIFLYTLAFGGDEDGQPVRGILCQKFSARPDPTGLPYLDGMRPAAGAAADGLLTAGAMDVVQDSIYTSPDAKYSWSLPSEYTDASRFAGLTHPHYTVGDAPPEGEDSYRWTGVNGGRADYIAAYPTAPTDNLWTGTAFPAFIDLTPPFKRDRDGKADTSGRMVLGKFIIVTARTAGAVGTWIDHDGTERSMEFGNTYERINYGHTMFIGRDATEVQPRVSAKDWLPLTINGIAWQGNWFGYKGRM